MKNAATKTRKTPPRPADDGVPSGLSPRAEGLWRETVSGYAINDAAGLRLLESACRCWDRAMAAREQIEREGMTLPDRFGIAKPHALLAAERDAWSGFRQSLRALGLDLEPVRDGPGRPPGR